MIRDIETNRKRWILAELKSRRGRDTISAYVQMMLSGRINWQILSGIYRPKQLCPIATVKKFLKQTEVKEAMEQEIAKVLSAQGISEAFVIEKRKEVLEKAIGKNDLGNANKALDAFENLLNMKPHKTNNGNEVTEANFLILEETAKQALSEKSKITPELTQ